ncbi:MAG: hypothetical protein ACSHYB_02445 [Roseibacillus sp.]
MNLKTKLASATTALFGISATLIPLRAEAALIFSDANDGFLEVRDNLPPTNPWPQVHPDTNGFFSANAGEWFGPGLTTIVLPFELPSLGAVTNPFTSADLGVMVHEMGNATITDLDLYAVRTSATPAILISDWYNGSAFDGSATLIQESFLTPASSVGFVGAPNNNTNALGDAALLNYLNTAYASGAGAGDFVFLRLSYGSDSLAAGWDAYKITVREAGQMGEWPVIEYTAIPEPSAMSLSALSLLLTLRRRNRR